MKSRIAARIALAFFVLPVLSLFGQSPPTYQRVLLPVLVDSTLPGAYGSIWKTELWGFNESDLYVPVKTDPNHRCAIPEGCPSEPAQPHSAFGFGAGTYPAGRFIFVGSEHAGDVHFVLRIYDASRQDLTYGTTIPVVPETGFSSNPLPLVNVVVAPQFRAMLRVYGLDNLRDDVAVTIIRTDNPLVKGQLNVRVPLEPQQASELNGGNQSVPSFGTIPDLGAIIPPEMLVRGPVEPRFAVEVRPNAQRLWSFVSVTHNETQHFTIIAP